MRNNILKVSKKVVLLTVMVIAVYAVNNCKGKASNTGITVSMSDFISAYDNAEKVQVLDVRTPAEYVEGRVPGATLVPLDQIQAGTVIPFSSDSQIYVICRSGKRSYQATQYLRSHGYDKAVSVDGGTAAWISAGKAVEK